MPVYSGAQVIEFMVRPDRFELPTFWFVARRSIQLSYGRARQGMTSFTVANTDPFRNRGGPDFDPPSLPQ
jgi:hypothetical protein